MARARRRSCASSRASAAHERAGRSLARMVLPPRGRTAIKRMLGYLPQELGVYPYLSAREFLMTSCILKGLPDDVRGAVLGASII